MAASGCGARGLPVSVGADRTRGVSGGGPEGRRGDRTAAREARREVGRARRQAHAWSPGTPNSPAGSSPRAWRQSLQWVREHGKDRGDSMDGDLSVSRSPPLQPIQSGLGL